MPADELDATVADLVGGPDRAAGRRGPETKALLQGAADRDLDEQRRLEREAQVRRFRELAALMAGQLTGEHVSGNARERAPRGATCAPTASVVNNRIERGTVRRVFGFARPHRRLITRLPRRSP